MRQETQIRVPSLVRIKPGALQRLGIYLKREAFTDVLVLASPLPAPVSSAAREAMIGEGIRPQWLEVDGNRFEDVVAIFEKLPKKVSAVVGIGGGKALDSAKYLAFLARLPFLAVPTSLSNDGFCSPQASLTLSGRRPRETSLPPPAGRCRPPPAAGNCGTPRRAMPPASRPGQVP